MVHTHKHSGHHGSIYFGIFLLLALGCIWLWLSVAPLLVSDTIPTQELTADEAAAIAVNEVAPISGGYMLNHPRYQVIFDDDGLEMIHYRGDLRWHWAFSESNVDGILTGSITPRTAENNNLLIQFDRGGVIEQYVARTAVVEQQFIIPTPLELNGSDLQIHGVIESNGTFAQEANGWSWSQEDQVIDLGDVTVIDAHGEILPASMTVTAEGSTITVSEDSLATAAYPVTIDPTIEASDIQISNQNPDLHETSYEAFQPDVAASNEGFLVVWSGDSPNGSREIYGRFVYDDDTVPTYQTNYRRQYSDTTTMFGTYGNADVDATHPAVSFDEVNGRFYIVWQMDAQDDQFEIWGSEASAIGAPISSSQIAISMSTEDPSPYDSYYPDVACGSDGGKCLVVWQGDAYNDEDVEIRGRFIDQDGARENFGFTVSNTGPQAASDYYALTPAAAYDTLNNQFLVVWSANNTKFAHTSEYEIYGQIIGEDSYEIGGLIRISDVGPDNTANFTADFPDVAFDEDAEEYLVVWQAKESTVLNIFGQRLRTSGSQTGTNDFQVSNLTRANSSAEHPRVTSDKDGRFGVVWTQEWPDGDQEVYGTEINGNSVDGIEKLSDMGDTTDPTRIGEIPAVAFAADDYLIAWQGNDNTGYNDGDREIFIQESHVTGDDIENLRISDMKADPAVVYDLDDVVVGYNTDKEYILTVWEGETAEHGRGLYGDLRSVDGVTIKDGFFINDAQPKALDIAYDSVNDQFLLVWETEGHIFSQFLIESGKTPHSIPIPVSINKIVGYTGGNNGIPLTYDFVDPRTVFNPDTEEFLVVWSESRQGEINEIFAERVSSATRKPIHAHHPENIQVSTTSDWWASGQRPGSYTPDVAYNVIEEEYLVVWIANDGPTINGDLNVWMQRLEGTDASLINETETQISQGHSSEEGIAVAYNQFINEYLVVWSNNNGAYVPPDPTLPNGKNDYAYYALFGQRLNSIGEEIGEDDFQISDHDKFADLNPQVTAVHGGYHVLWTSIPADDLWYTSYEQWLDTDGNEWGLNDFMLSDPGLPWDTQSNEHPAAVPLSDGFGSEAQIYMAWTDYEIEGQISREPAPSAPPPPISTATVNGDGDLTLTWADDPDSIGYEIWRSTDPFGNYQRIATLPAGTTSYVVNSATADGQNYFFTVHGINAEGLLGDSQSPTGVFNFDMEPGNS